jgi:acyl carrier protein
MASDSPSQEQILVYLVSRLRKLGIVFEEGDPADFDISAGGLDSLELLELILQLESKYDVSIDAFELTQNPTAGKLAAYIFQAAA